MCTLHARAHRILRAIRPGQCGACDVLRSPDDICASASFANIDMNVRERARARANAFVEAHSHADTMAHVRAPSDSEQLAAFQILPC